MTMTMERAPAKRRARVSPVSVPPQAADNQWRYRGACRGVDPELFYEHTSSTVRETAKAVCWSCPVRRACMLAVMAEEAAFGGSAQQNEKYRFGVRGGYTSGERWAMAYPREAAAKREREAAKKRAARLAS